MHLCDCGRLVVVNVCDASPMNESGWIERCEVVLGRRRRDGAHRIVWGGRLGRLNCQSRTAMRRLMRIEGR